MKLWVLPPSTRSTTWWLAMMPTKRSISGATWPFRELRLIWAGLGFVGSGGSGIGSSGSIRVWDGLSSSATKRKTLEAQWWPLWYFSLQVKQSPRSRREAISSGERRLVGGGGGRAGDGKGGINGCKIVVSDYGGMVRGRKGGLAVTGRGRAAWRCLRNFSSWMRARPAAWASVRGWRICTSRRISGDRPATKQVNRKACGRPTTRLASSSNSDR